MTHRQDLLQAFDQLLAPERFQDHGPNGLQVEGREQVRRIGLEHRFIDVPNPA